MEIEKSKEQIIEDTGAIIICIVMYTGIGYDKLDKLLNVTPGISKNMAFFLYARYTLDPLEMQEVKKINGIVKYIHERLKEKESEKPSIQKRKTIVKNAIKTY